jgi:hypothetical protein
MDANLPNGSTRSSVALGSAWPLAAVFILALTGCATLPPPPGGKFEADERPPTTFGRLVSTRYGEPQKVSNGIFDWFQCYGLVRSESDNRGLVFGFTEDGWFSWSLDPGRYVLTDLWCRRGDGVLNESEITLPVNAAFQVVQGTGTTYIGHFSLTYADRRFQPIGWKMNEQEAAGEFARRYPNAPAAIAQQPVFDPGPGKFARISDACATEWHLDCYLRFGVPFEGVKVLEPNPVGSHHPGFGTADSPSPTLKWEAAPDPAVTYDVAVWEVVTYHVPYAITPNSEVNARGRLVVYAENLDAPRYAMVDPLKAKTLYYWSVRLRKGEGVSTWTRGHGFGGHGPWLGFETP